MVRAAGLQPAGHRFESDSAHHDLLTQTIANENFGQGFGEILRVGLAEAPVEDWQRSPPFVGGTVLADLLGAQEVAERSIEDDPSHLTIEDVKLLEHCLVHLLTTLWRHPEVHVGRIAEQLQCTLDKLDADLQLLDLPVQTAGHQVTLALDLGQPLADDTDWANPAWRSLNPPLDYSGSNGLSFKCDWDNTTDKAVTFGEGALDEMCFVLGYYYPSSGVDTCIDGS